MKEPPVASKSETPGDDAGGRPSGSCGRAVDGRFGDAARRNIVCSTYAKVIFEGPSQARIISLNDNNDVKCLSRRQSSKCDQVDDRPEADSSVQSEDGLTYDPEYGFETGTMGPDSVSDPPEPEIEVPGGATVPATVTGPYHLPGEGRRGKNCGSEIHKVCDDCVDQKREPSDWWTISRCEQRDCPECGPTWWAVRQAKVIRGRLQDGAEHYRTRIHDVILSPPPYHPLVVGLRDCDPGDAKSQHCLLRRLLYEVCKIGWIDGGCAVFHPYRSQHAGGIPCESPFCREQHYYFWGPHFHVFGLSDFVARGDYVHWKTGVLMEGGGWVLIRMDSFQPEVLDYYKYALDHCGLLRDEDGDDHPLTHAYTWFGSMSPRVFDQGAMERAARDVAECCPYCGGTRVHVLMDPAILDLQVRVMTRLGLGDRPPPPAICPDCGCGDCRLIREAGPCDHVFKPDPYSPRITRVGGCTGTIDPPLMGESMVIIRCMSGYSDYLEPM